MHDSLFRRGLRYIGSGYLLKKVRAYTQRRLSDVLYGKYSSPIGDDYRSDKAGVYDATRTSSEFWKNEDRALQEFMDSVVDIKTVLDAPFGTGRFLKYYVDRDMEVTALDSSSDMLRFAAEKLPHEYKSVTEIVSLLSEVPLQDNAVDLVVSFRFLQWVVSYENALIALQELQRITNKYAIIELCVGRHLDGKGPKLYKNKTLWNRLNFKECCDLLNENGFNVENWREVADDEENPGLTVFFCKKSKKDIL